ncbi:glycoside hydrolase [Thozetella sp. PMI_491]|nr:glycoside hydrolase [Thozetella sp. PMI_491]
MVTDTHPLPRLAQVDSTWQLTVDDKPYLILGAELQNSSMSSARYMDTVWQKLADMSINTVLGAVTWEDIEPEEGKFDFSELDAVITGARQHNLRLIVLWFGSFKNGMSTYAPAWVKTNPKRFPRMQVRKDGGLETSEVISIFHEETMAADAKAFTALMTHLKEMDSQRTVIMVQVENEVGLLQDSRDGSSSATRIFTEPVPADVVDFLAADFDALHPHLKRNFSGLQEALAKARSSGYTSSWEEVFGKSIYTDEIFMAYHYALYVEKVAAAGRAAHQLPLFTNVWLPRAGQADSSDNVAGGGGKPGEYPSGGAVSNVLDIWQRFAPTLAFISPDIYLVDYSSLCEVYRHRGRPLFIPEQRRDDFGARRVWKAIGTYQAIGTSPFGIDTLERDTSPWTKHYKLLASVSQHILKARTKPRSMIGFYFDEVDEKDEQPVPVVRRFTGFELAIDRAFVFGKPTPGAGIVIELAPGRFLLVGWGFRVEFKSTSPTSAFTGILRFEEKSVVNATTGELRTERKLNGDETRSGKWCNMPDEDPDYGEGVIAVTIPGRTMIAEATVYSLDKADVEA